MPEQIRLLGDNAPVETIFDPPGDVEALDQRAAELAADAAGDEEAAEQLSAEEAAERYRSRQQDKISAFEGTVCEIITTARTAMVTARSQLGLEGRIRRETEKYRMERLPELDPITGEVIEGGRDAHLKAGLSLGLFVDNCNTLPAHIGEQMISGGRRPYDLEPNGRRKENDLKKAMLEDLVDNQLAQGGWRGEFEAALRDLPKHGTCIIRQSWTEELEVVQTEEGEFEEDVKYRGECFRHWPILDCAVSHPYRPNAWDQAAVIWNSRVTLADLTRNEKVFQVSQRVQADKAGNPILIPLFAERGRFINLERLRRAQQHNPSTEFEEKANETAQTLDSTDPDRDMALVSATTVHDLVEFQGYFPMGALMRQGALTGDMLSYYGISLKSGGEELTGEPAARMADQLMWYISILLENGDTASPSIVEIRPCPYRRQRNELIHGVFIPDGSNFYGLSSDAIGADVEAAADKMLNDIVDIMDNNANPPRGVNGSMFDSEADAQKAASAPGTAFIFNRGDVTPEQVLKYFEKPFHTEFPAMLQTVIQVYNQRTMASQLQKGGVAATETDTLGEAREQTMGNEKRLADIIRRLAETQLVAPSIVLIIEDIDWFYSDDELEREAKRIAGERGLEARTIFPTDAADSGRRRSLAKEFKVKSAGAVAIEREVATQFLFKVGNEAKDLPTLNRERIYRDGIGMMGLDPDRYFIDLSGPMPPRKEFEMLLAGDKPEVDPMEDAAGIHLPQHQAQMMILSSLRMQHIANGEPVDAIDGWIEVLEAHILETADLAQQQMLMMMQQAAAQQAAGESAGGAGGAGKGGGGKGGNGGEKTPPAQQQTMAGIEGAAMQKPGTVRKQ